ncbi:ABC transporter substrate-binding protein [Aquibacillus rhizosphaerae]|uniref:Extracellular solute-binding protein n=1 Tax=Aquibacillus rhizosphaerae TaxID=3051431 RepID=A0ABT7L2D5_9BACI|nr:extracellular solute-binding protein [Aquibacillus sp. LR5S19]MDL4839330.1 extracellular solute-binding protein [Aquibacillus sp. LR5S19]
MKKVLFLILGLSMVFWLAACSDEGTSGESDENTEGNDTEQATDDNEEEANEDEQVTIRIAWWGSQPRHDYTLEVIEMYEEQNPNVNIEPEYASWDDYWQKLAPQAAANELPDIVQMDLSYLSQYAQNNQLADLNPFFGNGIDTSNIGDSILSGGKVGDGIYGFNLGVNAVGFHYNPTLLEEVGIDSIPEGWTWDDYQEMTQKAVDAGYYFDTGMTADVFFNYYLRTQGKRLYAEDGSGLGYDDDQLFVDFFSIQAEQVEKEATPTPDFLAQLAGPEDDPVVKGEAIGMFQWSNQFVGLEEISGLEFDMAPMPGPNVSDGLFLKPSMFFSISENSDQKDAAAEFISFFVNDIEANKLILGDRGVPGSSEVKEVLKAEVSASQAEVFEYIEWAEENSSDMGAPDPAGAGEIIELIVGLAEQINYGEVSLEDAAANFRQQAESILGN